MQEKLVPQKRFTEKKKIVIGIVTFLLLVLSQPVFADDFHMELEPLFGARFGTIGEFVYSTQGSEDKKLSELYWYLTPIWTIGGNISLQYKKLEVSVFGNLGIPAKAGVMSDTDYMNLDGKITNFSSHDMRLHSLAETGGFIGFKFSPLLRLSIKPYAGFTFQQIAMICYDGYRQYLSENPTYTQWSNEIPKTVMYGDSIKYTQEYYLPWLGVELDFNSYLFSNTPITIKCSAAVAPYVWAYALDEHLKRSLEFFDQMEGGYAFDFKCTSFFWVTKKDAVVFGAGFTIIPEILGATSIRNKGEEVFLTSMNSKGSTSYQTVNVSLGYKRMLFN